MSKPAPLARPVVAVRLPFRHADGRYRIARLASPKSVIHERLQLADFGCKSVSYRHTPLPPTAPVKRLTELHGGTVIASSAGLGAGATFAVRLPIAADRQFEPGARLQQGYVAPGDEAKATPSIQDVKVLLVEDDPDGRDMVGHVLSENGGHVRAWSRRSTDARHQWQPTTEGRGCVFHAT